MKWLHNKNYSWKTATIFPSSINDIILNPFPPYIPLLERFFLRCLAAEYFAAPPYADPFLSAPIKFSIVFFHSGMAAAGIPEFADKALGAAEVFSEYANPVLLLETAAI